MKKKETRRQAVDDTGLDTEEVRGAPSSSEKKQDSESGTEDLFADLKDVVTAEELMESQEMKEGGELNRERLQAALKNKGLSPRFALELVESYDPAAIDEALVNSVKERTKGYGIDFEDLPANAQQELLVMSLGAARGRSEKSKEVMNDAVETAIHRELFLRATQHIDSLEAGLREKVDANELKDRLRTVMESMNGLSKKISLDKEDDRELWGVLFRQFETMSNQKRETGEADVQQVFKEVFDEFSDFIEDEMVGYYMKAKTEGVEQAVNYVYGRSKEEIEEIKVRNRQNVAAEIAVMKDSPGVTLEMIEKLHALNNRGIVPKKLSRLRTNVDVTFGQRVGVAGADVKPEVENLLDRTNDLIDKDATGMSKLRYEIEASKLHNDLLDMHPFADRNGSTALLYLELLMAKKGYEPPKERNKDYYNNLRKILGNNPVAVAVVGYEQYRIANTPGFYEGKVMSEESRQKQQERVEKRQQAADAAEAERKAAKAAKKRRPAQPPQPEAF